MVPLLLCIFAGFAIVCLGLVYYVGDLAKYQEVLSTREGQNALRGAADPDQLDQVLKKFPTNNVVRLVALAKREAATLDAAARKRLNDAEPATVSKATDLSTAGRDDLEVLRRDLKIAESNATAFEPPYLALVKAERDKAETEVRSLKVGSDTVVRFMAMIDEQNKEITAFVSKLLAARLEYYGAYGKCVELLIREFGVYRVEKGQFVFPFQRSAESYNRAAAAMTAAAKRIADLESERTNLKPVQFDRWKAFADR
ncbi:MAG TPA: hypothetical protein VFL62_17245 [Bradyrhizobium sp.]|uniref:hypothetical protein n=1 Tax=Bradyrhizobium sp. TaxID=376 RepID=UPI002D810670|nr:hypothetical protein [Bradyrhizobium sp.]HET7887971.1 hypothetical protein [Bradyrhizobium sp.]